MNKKTMTITAMVLGIVAVSGSVLAYGNGLDSENREAIMNAVESGDYEAWKELMTQTMTEERFNKMVEMHEGRQAVIQALEDENYEAWKEAVENLERPKITDIITEENFGTFVELHEAKMNGDYETVKELSEELGIGPMGGKPCGFRDRMGWKMKHMIPLEGE